ncbi:hypothetical protein MKZ38_003074 [Zalerion maritima]|uniref:Uncharacterized protein n=1 Tax=Zalerion maritima TaxID=339359 RepID=A0AAD5WRY1_9PEZI|nr:hypothetical protein MKZ38_003074 [Zalerion maritima]
MSQPTNQQSTQTPFGSLSTLSSPMPSSQSRANNRMMGKDKRIPNYLQDKQGPLSEKHAKGSRAPMDNHSQNTDMDCKSSEEVEVSSRYGTSDYGRGQENGSTYHADDGGNRSNDAADDEVKNRPSTPARQSATGPNKDQNGGSSDERTQPELDVDSTPKAAGGHALLTLLPPSPVFLHMGGHFGDTLPEYPNPL